MYSSKDLPNSECEMFNLFVEAINQHASIKKYLLNESRVGHNNDDNHIGDMHLAASGN